MAYEANATTHNEEMEDMNQDSQGQGDEHETTQETEQDQTQKEWVPYVRKGVQRFRKKRGSGGNAHHRTEPYQIGQVRHDTRGKEQQK